MNKLLSFIINTIFNSSTKDGEIILPTPPPSPTTIIDIKTEEPVVAIDIPEPKNAKGGKYNVKDLDLSNNGVNFIKQWESFIPKAFWDYKQWSIGYGTVATNSKEVIDEPEAARRLGIETKVKQAAIKKYVTVPLTQNMYDALTSFTFNVGVGWLTNGSSIKTRLNAGEYQGAANGLLAWNRAGGKVNLGLKRRRDAERNLFLK